MERDGTPEERDARTARELLAGLDEALAERQALLRGPDTARAREDAEALRLLTEDYLALLTSRVARGARRPPGGEQAARATVHERIRAVAHAVARLGARLTKHAAAAT